MTISSLIVLLIIGAVAGWLAGRIVKGAGFGLTGNIIVGILGAFVSARVLPSIGLSLGAGLVGSILHATIGAVLLLWVVLFLKKNV
jgi:uncharacterized membrane protein YeaQ/YmgE (transglycosylase-associated protein family)